MLHPITTIEKFEFIERLMRNNIPPRHRFIYGRPVSNDEFLNRDSELGTIFNRIYHGESTVISGEPHVGKSSLLLQLCQPDIQRDYLGQDANKCIFIDLDLHAIGTQYTPAVFWQEVLEHALQKLYRNSAITNLAQRAANKGYARRPLERFFKHIGQRGGRLVLLLDEFERLLAHPNFKYEPSFFALLRSLATRTRGLATISASRLSVAEMNQQGRDLLSTGSPFFNNTIEVRLPPFDEETVALLLERGGSAFLPVDRRYIRHVAGGNPYLLQAMAASLYEAQGEGQARRVRAAEQFYARIASHFDDLWSTLDDNTRTTAVILSLLQLGGQSYGDNFNYGEIERSDIFGLELQNLAELGLAEQDGTGWSLDLPNMLVWRGGRWSVSAQAFAWWVRDTVIAETRRLPTYQEWLHNQRYRFLLTQAQWDGLLNTVRKTPPSVVRGVGGLARALCDGLLKGE